jgi:hypothetical protein
MAVHLLILSLLAALSGLLAVVAGQRVEPFYSKIAPYIPKARSLYSARQAIENEGRKIRIRDGYRKELHTIHRILVEEYGFDEQYYPVEIKFMHNSFEVKYAENRTQGRRQTSRDDLISLVDSRVSEVLGQLSAVAAIICVLAFAALIVSAVV